MEGEEADLPAHTRLPGGSVLSTFTADAVDQLRGPTWLQHRRTRAFERFSTTPLPTVEEEVWRYSRIPELDLGAYRPHTGAPSGEAVPDGLQPVLDTVEERAALVVVHNGSVVHVDVDPNAAAAGLEVGRLADLDPEGAALGTVTGEANGAFSLLHDAFVADPVLVRVRPGLVVDAPVVVLHWTDGTGLATFPHLVVQAGDDSEVVVYDHSGSADVDALVLPVVELAAAPASRLRYVNAQLLGQRVWQLGRQLSRGERDARLSTSMVALGGGYARLEVESTLAGRGASGEMLAVYFGEGNQMHDFRTLQDHEAPKTMSDLLFKGAVQGRSRSVYTGMIHIGKQAAGVDAFQTNRNIKLSDGAWAESVPNLEIENNDVRCSHASAVGPVDEDQRYYLESRGVPPARAERLIVLGFFEDVLERLPVPAAVPALRSEITAKLDRRDVEVAR
ncbi:MAG TPA: SufD family Fe-S cluster assembly protein [Acidimicrobiales bacterium]|nr:SufD family Fe-S cluster assembly protein [Acidimicrobiales bacterium]